MGFRQRSLLLLELLRLQSLRITQTSLAAMTLLLVLLVLALQLAFTSSLERCSIAADGATAVRYSGPAAKRGLEVNSDITLLFSAPWAKRFFERA
jgi:hypothetical protein